VTGDVKQIDLPARPQRLTNRSTSARRGGIAFTTSAQTWPPSLVARIAAYERAEKLEPHGRRHRR